jgi:hypothetical protein
MMGVGGISNPCPPEDELLPWRLTAYYIADARDYPGYASIPIRNPAGQRLAMVSPRAFAAAALEGTLRLPDGRLLNVASNPDYLPCDPVVFQPVFDFAMKQGWIPKKAGYAGIKTDGYKAKASRCFEVKTAGPGGWPLEHGIELAPYKTVAADIGRLSKHDPLFKKAGGVVPLGTSVWVEALYGKTLPVNASGLVAVHDGWVTVNDTGGGIFGAHFDVFTGTRALLKQYPVPDRTKIWFQGVIERLGKDYNYGLK